MTISIQVQHITSAKRSALMGIDDMFDAVYIEAASVTVALLFPHGTGQAVADAINAAVTK